LYEPRFTALVVVPGYLQICFVKKKTLLGIDLLYTQKKTERKGRQPFKTDKKKKGLLETQALEINEFAKSKEL